MKWARGRPGRAAGSEVGKTLKTGVPENDVTKMYGPPKIQCGLKKAERLETSLESNQSIPLLAVGFNQLIIIPIPL